MEANFAGVGQVFIEGGVTTLMREDQGERSNLQNELEGAESQGERECGWGPGQRRVQLGRSLELPTPACGWTCIAAPWHDESGSVLTVP